MSVHLEIAPRSDLTPDPPAHPHPHRIVAGHARDADDLLFLLRVLGIVSTPVEWKPPTPQYLRPQHLQPCGTVSAHQWHRNHRERPCDPCREAVRRYGRQRRREQNRERPPRPVPECGTLSAYRRHLRRKEPTCAPCKAAQAETNRAWVNRNRMTIGGRSDSVELRHPTPQHLRDPALAHCGTPAARNWHYRHGERPCEDCRQAYNTHQNARRRSRRSASESKRAGPRASPCPRARPCCWKPNQRPRPYPRR